MRGGKVPPSPFPVVSTDFASGLVWWLLKQNAPAKLIDLLRDSLDAGFTVN